ncbi:MAG TPA: Ig-like domain-containing protein, partial [Burkholderiaceae bacterium]|nr:Ig-like domain-containing protein [Burkholderiaceae bacterium]
VVDTVAPGAPTIGTIAVDGTINAAEQGATLSGTAEAGATVLLTLGADNLRSVTANDAGVWSYTLVSADLAAMGQGAETITARAQDAAGNAGGAATRGLVVDTVAPGAPTIGTVAGDGTIDASEQGATLSGTAEAGATVLLTLGAGNVRTVTANDAGAWSYTLVPADIAAMGEGAETISAQARDAAGNAGAAATRSVLVETLPPGAPTIGAVAGDGTINAAEQGATLSGTAEAGSTVLLTLGVDNVRSVTANDAGVWSYTLVSADIAAMGEGAETISAQARDAAGNLGTAVTRTIAIDLAAPVLASTTPVDEAGGVSSGSSIVLAFGEPVVAGTGSFTISNEGGVVATLAVGDASRVSISGSTVTLDPASELPSGRYAVTYPTGTLADAAGNPVAGVDGTVLNFEVVGTLTGTSGADVLAGGAGVDLIEGGAGDDRILGDAGDDDLDGGDGNDRITGGLGADAMAGGAGDDRFAMTAGAQIAGDSIDGGLGNDRLVLFNAQSYDLGQAAGITGVDRIDMAASVGSASVTITSAMVAGADGNQDGVTGDVRVVGFDGAPILADPTSTASPGATTAGFTIDASALTASQSMTVAGQVGSGVADPAFAFGGMNGNDTIIGGAGADRIAAGLGADTIDAGAGADRIQLFSAAELVGDDIDGGAGDDRLQLLAAGDYDLSVAAGITGVDRIDLAVASGTVSVVIDAATATGANANNDGTFGDIRVVGYDPATHPVTPSATTADTTIDARALGAGQRLVVNGSVGSGVSDPALAFGGLSGDDRILGGAGNDVIDGGAGNDRITGGLGADTMIGGTGDDRFAMTAGAQIAGDSIDGGLGNDRLVLFNAESYGLSQLAGITGVDRIDMAASSGNASVTITSAMVAGADGNQDGVTGDVRVVGFDGAPILADPTATASPAATTASMTIDASALGSSQSLTVAGQVGSGVADPAFAFGGLSGDDTIIGGAGADRIAAGLGADTIEAGGGADRIQVFSAAELVGDDIDGGAGDDRLQLL